MSDEPKNAREILEGMRRRDLVAFLERDPRVREWLASGVLLSTSEAAVLLGVERPRIWRWVNQRRLLPIARTGATPLFLLADVQALKRKREQEMAAQADAQAANA